jgi:hypothetical protein
LLFTDVTDTRARALCDIIKNDLVCTRKVVIEGVSIKKRQIFWFVLPTQHFHLVVGCVFCVAWRPRPPILLTSLSDFY